MVFSQTHRGLGVGYYVRGLSGWGGVRGAGWLAVESARRCFGESWPVDRTGLGREATNAKQAHFFLRGRGCAVVGTAADEEEPAMPTEPWQPPTSVADVLAPPRPGGQHDGTVDPVHGETPRPKEKAAAGRGSGSHTEDATVSSREGYAADGEGYAAVSSMEDDVEATTRHAGLPDGSSRDANGGTGVEAQFGRVAEAAQRNALLEVRGQLLSRDSASEVLPEVSPKHPLEAGGQSTSAGDEGDPVPLRGNAENQMRVPVPEDFGSQHISAGNALEVLAGRGSDDTFTLSAESLSWDLSNEVPGSSGQEPHVNVSTGSASSRLVQPPEASAQHGSDAESLGASAIGDAQVDVRSSPPDCPLLSTT